ncbi:type II secretion system F family protein [Microtetraspora sp. AC03309]|uniref:type II secretion system F family protein n=1 Tax=Microtetraspora sp. AC03309 TaxID=2779376 RepID=UPI001E2A4C1C|nr:type II secretion system F family protein [Microtetraspora sp. AC03309]MCC5581802.1 type II secretion system F family protein [Microtetraspora sp. AC03309]
MVAVAVLAAALAAWVWAGPGIAAARVAGLTGARGRTPRRRAATLLDRPRPERQAAAWRAVSIELCQGIVAELAAGGTPGDALSRAVSVVTLPDAEALRPVVATARDGGDVAAALLRAAPPHGGEGLVRLAACWQVSMAGGGGLAALVERLGGSLREAETHRQDLAAQLAGPRATARLLAVLPALGLLMAAGLGMSPLSFLFGEPAGIACLVTGLALDGVGVWWTNRIVAHAVRGHEAGGPGMAAHAVGGQKAGGAGKVAHAARGHEAGSLEKEVGTSWR